MKLEFYLKNFNQTMCSDLHWCIESSQFEIYKNTLHRILLSFTVLQDLFQWNSWSSLRNMAACDITSTNIVGGAQMELWERNKPDWRLLYVMNIYGPHTQMHECVSHELNKWWNEAMFLNTIKIVECRLWVCDAKNLWPLTLTFFAPIYPNHWK